MLGGFRMSSSNAQQRDNLARQSLERAQFLLEEALNLIDEHAEAPELGARLQEVIDRLKAKLA